MDEGHAVDVNYVDFAKAVDSVDHRFLWAKIKSFGLGDVVVRWIEAYLLWAGLESARRCSSFSRTASQMSSKH